MIQANYREEYLHEQRLGQKECRERTASGLDPYPAVLDRLLGEGVTYSVQELPVQEIPIERIVGTKSAGRASAFSASFYPLLDADSEFAAKWMALCEAHLSDTGIQESIECFEYLGEFYIQEGNKRTSVLKAFGASHIAARVKRVLLPETDELKSRLYAAFLDFFKVAGLYDVQFRKPGDYAKLLAALGKQPGEPWTEEERRSFLSRFVMFKEAFSTVGGRKEGLQPEDALLLWLQLHPFNQLSELSVKELKASLTELWGDVQASAKEKPSLRTQPETEKKSILEKVISSPPKHLHIALVCQLDADRSPWTRGHLRGAEQLSAALSAQTTVRLYLHADSAEEADAALEQAVDEGAELVFTAAPALLQPTLKAAVKHPKTRFLNCSMGAQLSSVRSYYCRSYEGKFITGLIAGALADNNLVGYVAPYPILGEPASINAFALGARMTNPRARVLLGWSCLPGDPVQLLRDRGARVISNRDLPVYDTRYMDEGRFGTFLIENDERVVPLASPVWMWGKLYETIASNVLAGKWNQKDGAEAINYWWGMDSGAIDVALSEQIPSGVRSLAEHLMNQLRLGSFEPFRQRLVNQSGDVINDGSASLSSEEILHMDWLCEAVDGSIPAYEELLPVSRALVRELGLHKDLLPPETGGAV